MDAHTRLQQAYQLARSGKKDEARQIVQETLKAEPQNADAWYMAAYLTDNLENKIKGLERALGINPFHPQAKQALDKLKPPENPLDTLIANPISSPEPLILPKPKKNNPVITCLAALGFLVLVAGLASSPFLGGGTSSLDAKVKEIVDRVGPSKIGRITTSDEFIGVYFPISDLSESGRLDAEDNMSILACEFRKSGLKSYTLNLVAVIPSPISPDLPNKYIGHAVFVTLNPSALGRLDCGDPSRNKLSVIATTYILDPQLE